MVFWVPMVASLNLHPGVLSKKSAALLHRFVWVLVKVCGIIALGVLELLNSIFQAMGIWQISMANIVINRLCLMGLMFVMVRIFDAFGVIASQPITREYCRCYYGYILCQYDQEKHSNFRHTVFHQIPASD